MFIPCQTCTVQGGCRVEDVTTREAVFAWLAEAGFKCDDYQAGYYHGVEGVFDAGFNLDGGHDDVAGRAGRHVHYESVHYCGVK